MRRFILGTTTFSGILACIVFGGLSYAATPGADPPAQPGVQSTTTPNSIQFTESPPKFPEPVREETMEESAESFLIENVIGSNANIFASGAWIGGQPLRELYVKSGFLNEARALLDQAGIAATAYRILEVPLSAQELDAALQKASALLIEAEVDFSTISPVPQTGELEIGAPRESSLLYATDPALPKTRTDDSTTELLSQLETLGVRWVTEQGKVTGDSALVDDATPNVGSRIASLGGDCSMGYPIVIPQLSVKVY